VVAACNAACALALAARIKRLPLRLQSGQQEYVAAPAEPASQPASQGGGAAGELGLALPPLLQLTPAATLQPLPSQGGGAAGDLLAWMPISSALQPVSHGGSSGSLQPSAVMAPVALGQRQAAPAHKVNDVPMEGPHRLTAYQQRIRLPGSRRSTLADQFRPVTTKAEQALFHELYQQFTASTRTQWQPMTSEWNLRVSEARKAKDGSGEALFYKRTAQLQQYEKQLCRLVAEGNSLALYDIASVPPLVAPSLQQAAIDFVVSGLLTAPSLPLPPPDQAARAGPSAVSGTRLPSGETGSGKAQQRGRGYAEKIDKGGATGKGGTNVARCCSKCQDAGVPREYCMVAGGHKAFCPFEVKELSVEDRRRGVEELRKRGPIRDKDNVWADAQAFAVVIVWGDRRWQRQTVAAVFSAATRDAASPRSM
jgi:hypothetical protein